MPFNVAACEITTGLTTVRVPCLSRKYLAKREKGLAHIMIFNRLHQLRVDLLLMPKLQPLTPEVENCLTYEDWVPTTKQSIMQFYQKL